jgi:probable aminopeptidase NPEPL1
LFFQGIVFDTGGLAIKSKDGMCGMKRDMGGSAGLFGGFLASVKAKVNKNIGMVMCVAENAVSGDALRQDDVITLRSGKTVEINNTDAEGRLVLGDGVYYASTEALSGLKSDENTMMIDMATLTGAQGVATGQYFG